MISIKRIEEIIGIILIIGTLCTAALVILGGSIFLIQHGQENMQTELLNADHYAIPITTLLIQDTVAFSPMAIIELGLLLLVAIQVLRVLLLFLYYLVIRDVYFSLISLFILLMLVYSIFWRQN